MKRPWLAPFVPIYAAGVALRDLRLRRDSDATRRLNWPVVSVGNISTGGAGKTPLAIAVAKLLTSRGIHVDVLSRGYGRTSRDAARVRPDGTAAEFGDEPLLIAREAGAPVYVAQQRYEAGLLAEAEISGQSVDNSRQNLTVHILDDGFQHRQLARDVDILLMNRADWEDSLLPAGNLREPLRAMQRAQVIALPGDDQGLEQEIRHSGWQGSVWRIHRRMDVPAVDGPVAAFCGIARSNQFFSGIEAAGIRVASRTSFRDHHRYTAPDMKRLLASARAGGAAAFITTEKDLVRLGDLATTLSSELPLETARLQTDIEDSKRLVDALVERLDAQRSKQPL